MTDDRRKPELWPGAEVYRANLRPKSHEAHELARVLAEWLRGGSRLQVGSLSIWSSRSARGTG